MSKAINLRRLRVKPASFRPAWYHRPLVLLVVMCNGYLATDGVRSLLAGHWWGIYFVLNAFFVVVGMRADVALQRAERRDKIAELERELGISILPPS